MDLAFFARDTIKPRQENSSSKYAVVNYEPHGMPTEVSGAYDLKKQLEEIYDKVYNAATDSYQHLTLPTNYVV